MPSVDQYLTGNPQITFSKNVYRRHTNILSKKDVYEFENNRVIIPPTEEVDVIKNIWISNCDNIKCVSMFAVDQNLNMEEITTNTTDTIENNDIMLFSKLNKEILDIFNPKKSNGYWQFPITENALMTNQMLKKGRNILFVIDTIDNNIKHNIIVKRLIVNSVEESKLFNNTCHEYLVKRLKTFEYDIKIGHNEINTEFIGDSIAYIILNSQKGASNDMSICLECNISCISSQEMVDKTIKYNICSTQYDPEHSHFVSENSDVYVLDVFANLYQKSETFAEIDYWEGQIGGHQPKGNFNMKQCSCFKIDSKINTKLEITYAIFDVLRYSYVGQSQLYFANQQYGEPIVEKPINDIYTFVGVKETIDLKETIIEKPVNKIYTFVLNTLGFIWDYLTFEIN